MNIIKNISVNSLIGIVSKVISFLLLPIILNNSNQEIYGKYAFVLILILWFEKLSVGPFTNGLVRWFNKSKISKIEFSSISFTSIILSILSLILFYIISFFIELEVNINLLLIINLSTIFYSYIESFLRFQGYHKSVAIFLGIRNISIPCFQIILLFFSESIESLLFPVFISNSIFILLGFKYLKKLMPHLKFNIYKITDMLKYSIPLITIGLAVTSYFLYDRYLIKYFFSYKTLAEFTIANQIAAVMSIAIATPVKQVITPDLLSIDKKKINFTEFINKVYPLIFFISISIIVFIYYFNNYFISFIIGDNDYFIDKYLILLILIYHFFSIISIIYRSPFLLTFQSNFISAISLISIFISAIFLFFYIKEYGIIIVGVSYIMMSIIPIITFRFFNKTKYKFSSKILFLEILIFIIMCLLIINLFF